MRTLLDCEQTEHYLRFGRKSSTTCTSAGRSMARSGSLVNLLDGSPWPAAISILAQKDDEDAKDHVTPEASATILH